MPNLKSETLRSKLALFPPFIVLSLAKTRVPRQTSEELSRKFSHKNRLKRKRMLWRGKDLPRKLPTRRMSRDEIAAKSGLNARKVARIGERLTWDDVSVSDMLAFSEACNVDFLRLAKIKYLINSEARRGHHFRHLSVQQMIVLAKKIKESQRVPECAKVP
jgi:hypothetical protein